MIYGTLLAGGAGKRMGGNKPDRLLGGRPLAQWALDSLQQVAQGVILSVAPDQVPPRLETRVPVLVCEDLLPNRGPLAGIYSALRTSEADTIIAVPCDAPFVEPTLLRLLLDERHGWDAVVPELDAVPQVQIGVYNRSALPALIEALNGPELSVRGLLQRLRVRFIPEHDVRVVDPSLRSFFNVNTVADLGRAESMVATLCPG